MRVLLERGRLLENLNIFNLTLIHNGDFCVTSEKISMFKRVCILKLLLSGRFMCSCHFSLPWRLGRVKLFFSNTPRYVLILRNRQNGRRL